MELCRIEFVDVDLNGGTWIERSTSFSTTAPPLFWIHTHLYWITETGNILAHSLIGYHNQNTHYNKSCKRVRLAVLRDFFILSVGAMKTSADPLLFSLEQPCYIPLFAYATPHYFHFGFSFYSYRISNSVVYWLRAQKLKFIAPMPVQITTTIDFPNVKGGPCNMAHQRPWRNAFLENTWGTPYKNPGPCSLFWDGCYKFNFQGSYRDFSRQTTGPIL